MARCEPGLRFWIDNVASAVRFPVRFEAGSDGATEDRDHGGESLIRTRSREPDGLLRLVCAEPATGRRGTASEPRRCKP